MGCKLWVTFTYFSTPGEYSATEEVDSGSIPSRVDSKISKSVFTDFVLHITHQKRVAKRKPLPWKLNKISLLFPR